MRKIILVTGSTGFIGSRLIPALEENGYDVIAALRKHDSRIKKSVQINDIGPDTDWSSALTGVDAIIHLAARVHIMKETCRDPLHEYLRINTKGTLNLANQAARAGVKRFIFMSTVGVNGRFNPAGKAFKEDDLPAPQNNYAISKYEAEKGLKKLSEETGMEVVIIRAPLVYGPNAKGNFAYLIKWMKKGFPLPLGSLTKNYRSFISVDNLVDFIILCIEHPKAAGQVFFVSDGEDLSTAELVRRIGSAMRIKVRLIPIPAWTLKVVDLILGKKEFSRRLCDSLRIDISKAKSILGWNPPISVDEGLKRAVSQK